MENQYKRTYRGFRDLKVYQLSYKLAMELFEITKKFPVDERYSLSDQIRRSSRSIIANIAEGWMKRIYIRMFVSKIADALGESGETEVWLNLALDCGYIDEKQHTYFLNEYANVNKMLFGMIRKPDKFIVSV